jgi:hypothetical protein
VIYSNCDNRDVTTNSFERILIGFFLESQLC